MIARETRPRIISRAGNSVDTATGAFLVEQTVMSVYGGRDLDFTLNYNSLFTAGIGALGSGWTHNFEARIFVFGDLRGVYWGPVAYNVFRPTDSTATNFVPQDEANRYDRLTFQGSPRVYRLVRQDGSEFVFDADGRLSSAATKGGLRIEVIRNAGGAIETLREPLANRRIEVAYAKHRPANIGTLTDGLGRVVYFEYDAAGRLAAIRNPVIFGHSTSPFSVQVPLPDNDPGGVTMSISVADQGPVGLVRLSSLNLLHSRPSDVRVFITSPSGKRVELSRPVPDAASETPGFSGSITGEFEGEGSGGTWRIQVVDTVAGASGTVGGGGLQFSGPSFPTYLTYDNGNLITLATDALGERLFQNAYDASGRVIAQDDGVDTNLIATFNYSETPGRIVTTFKDRAGNSQEYEHDFAYRLLRFQDALGNTTLRSYDANGNCIRYTDALGRATTFAYDEAGNLIVATDPSTASVAYNFDGSNNLTAILDPLGRRTDFYYNNDNNLGAVRDAAGNQDNRPYNGNRQIAGVLMADGGGINYSYTNGMLSSATHPAGSGVRTAYDAIGRMTRMTDADGFSTNIDYDPRGNVIRRTDALDRTREFFFDHRNRQIRGIEPSGATTNYEYDANDNVVAVTDPLGRITRYGYDLEDNLIRIVDPANAESAREYDAVGRLIAETDPEGNTLRYEYDAVGNRVATLNRDGLALERIVYDARDNPAETIDAFGNRWRRRYDLAGRLFEQRNPLDEVLLIELDEIDRPVAVRDPVGRRLRRTYYSDDVVRMQSDARGLESRFFYDQANRLTSIESYFGYTDFNFNGRDLLTRRRSPMRRTTDFTYDNAGQLTRLVRTGTAAGVTNSGESVNYTYDRDGRPTEIVHVPSAGAPALRTRRSWDVAGRLVQFTDDAGQAIGYGYDAAGNLAEIRYPDGSRVRYEYDAARRMTRVIDWAGRVTRFRWTQDGLLTAVLFPNGAQRRMEYDVAGRVRRRTELAGTGEAIGTYVFGYDAAGRLSVEDLGGAPGPANLPSSFLAQVSNDNRLASVNGVPITYDQDGNLTQGSFGSRTLSLRYDAGGRLTASGLSEYVYDAEDRLVSIRTSTGTTRLTFNPLGRLPQVLLANSPSGVTRYVHGVGLLYGERNGQIFVHHYDERGSTIGFTGPSGAIVGRVTYTPFGQIAERSGETDSIFLFHGLFGVVTTPDGLLWMRYRWYSPDLRRFLSVDARLGDITQPATLNRYAFLGNDPALRVDPDGEFWWVAVGALVGAVANVAVQVASDVVSGKVSDWQTYAGAALSGAVVGAGVALCPACGVAGTALIGAAGAAAGYAFERGLRGERVDAGEIATEVAVGGLTGGVAGGAGRIAGKLGSRLGPQFLGKLNPAGKALARRAVNGKMQIARQAVAQEWRRGLIRGALQGGTQRIADASGASGYINAGVTDLGGLVSGLFAGPSATAASPRVRHAVEDEAPRMLNRSGKGVYGEFVQWQTYLDFMSLAGRPLPANANNFLSVF